jgi:hypothetical protein
MQRLSNYLCLEVCHATPQLGYRARLAEAARQRQQRLPHLHIYSMMCQHTKQQSTRQQTAPSCTRCHLEAG